MKRSVSFSDDVQEYLRPSLTKEEKVLIYYDHQEIKQFREQDKLEKQAETEAAMKAAMEDAASSFGILLPGVKF